MEQHLTRDDLERIAFALVIYKAEKGEYPAALEALQPGILKEIPHDWSSGKPLVYKRIEKGYVLYSVGPNKIDDGGTGNPQDRTKGDIVVRVEE